MCDTNQISFLLERAVTESKRLIGADLDSVILYGSYARGDYDDESDIDIMLKINCEPAELEAYEDDIARICSMLSLEYDVTVSIHTVSLSVFERFKDALPFYKSIEEEGVRVA